MANVISLQMTVMQDMHALNTNGAEVLTLNR